MANLMLNSAKTTVLTLSAFVVLTTTALAQSVVDNTSDALDNSIRVSGPAYGSGVVTVGQSFATGADATSLTAITIDVTGNTGNTFQLALDSDNGGTPGSQIAVFSGATSPATGFETYTASSGISLDASTTYWLVASDSGSDNFYLGMTSSSSYSTTDGWSINPGAQYNRGSGWNVDAYTLLFSATATVTPAPEPSSLALIALGLGSGALCLRRRAVR